MTANELLALLGRAWPRLLIYPGGLAAFALVWLVGRIDDRRPTADHRPPTDPEISDSRQEAGDERVSTSALLFPVSYLWRSAVGIPALGSWIEVSAIVLPWLGLALLPLPHVAAINRSTDLIAVLGLLEWPLLLALAAELRSGDKGHAASRLAAALNGYPPLILATLVLVSAAGSFDIAALARPPGESDPARMAALHWLGAIAWALALPPVLGIGAFSAGRTAASSLRIGLQLRALGLAAIAALPWFPLVAGPDDTDFGGAGPTLLLAVPPLLLAALLWGYARLTGGHSARRWARAYLALDAALLLVLVWAAYAALQERLR